MPSIIGPALALIPMGISSEIVSSVVEDSILTPDGIDYGVGVFMIGKILILPIVLTFFANADVIISVWTDHIGVVNVLEGLAVIIGLVYSFVFLPFIDLLVTFPITWMLDGSSAAFSTLSTNLWIESVYLFYKYGIGSIASLHWNAVISAYEACDNWLPGSVEYFDTLGNPSH